VRCSAPSVRCRRGSRPVGLCRVETHLDQVLLQIFTALADSNSLGPPQDDDLDTTGVLGFSRLNCNRGAMWCKALSPSSLATLGPQSTGILPSKHSGQEDPQLQVIRGVGEYQEFRRDRKARANDQSDNGRGSLGKDQDDDLNVDHIMLKSTASDASF
jgi:hypothetical protein